ncbi:MAG: ATP-binding cassette domain-containing protein, partial [Pirellulaceae bacterium]
MSRQTLLDDTSGNGGSQRLLIQANGLVRSGPNRPLIDQASCQIFAGDRIALTGPSGSGKSLLLRSLALLDEVEQGTIRWQGSLVKPHDVPRFRSHVIYVHQQASLTEGTVKDALREPFA